MPPPPSSTGPRHARRSGARGLRALRHWSRPSRLSERSFFPRLRYPWLVAGVAVLALGCAGVAGAAVIGTPTEVFPGGAGGSTPVADRASVAETAPARSPAKGHPASPVPVPIANAHVRYEIDGPAWAGFVTFTTARHGLAVPETPIQLPWRTEFDASRGFIPTITAQNAGNGSISCRISVDGAVVSEVTSDGTHGVATCTGNVVR
jgi:Mycobacterium membrane protein